LRHLPRSTDISSNTRLPIPYDPGFVCVEPAHRKVHEALFTQNRALLIHELRGITALRNAVVGLDPRTLYTLECVPKGAHMHRDAAGFYQAVFYKDNTIVKHARLRQVRPSLLKAASVVGTQVLLVSISMQLNAIQETLGHILVDLHNERIAEVQAGIRLFEQGLLARDQANRIHVLHHAIQSLNSGVSRVILALKHQIETAPGPQSRFFDNWRKAKSRVAQEHMRLADESYLAALRGIGVLSEAYACLGEPDVASTVLKGYLSDLKAAGIREAGHKARLVPFHGDVLPEKKWEMFLEAEPLLIKKLDLCNSRMAETRAVIAIELKPGEIGIGKER